MPILYILAAIQMIKITVKYKINKDGTVEFKFKLKAKVVMRDGTDFEQRPKILLADKTIAEKQPVYSGSKMKIAFQAMSWANPMQGVGVSLRLKAVQLIEIVSEKPKANGDSSSSYDYGFGEEKVSNVPSGCLLYTSPSPRDRTRSRMPSSA